MRLRPHSCNYPQTIHTSRRTVEIIIIIVVVVVIIESISIT